MSSLTSCIRKAGADLQQEDRAAIIERSRQLRAQGAGPQEAADGAVSERISEVDAAIAAAKDGKIDVESTAFERWFEGGVVDVPVYHGSPERFGVGANTVVRADLYRPFWVTPDRELAQRYERGGDTVELRTNIRNPADLTAMANELLVIYNNDEEISSNGMDWDASVDGDISGSAYILTNSADVMDELRKRGYDSVTVRETATEISYGILSPGDVKKVAGNAGTFDRASPDIVRSAARLPDGISIVELTDGFDVFDGDKRIGRLRDNLKRGQAAMLDESANIDIITIDKEYRGRGIGDALYGAFNDRHGGRITPSGVTSKDAWAVWKRKFPAKVDEFVQREAARIDDGADLRLVVGNITDPEIAARVRGATTSITASVSRQTETEAFKKWFGDSKVVDADGKPLVVYHGTVVRPDSERVSGMGDINEFDRLFTTKFRAPSIDTVGSWFSTNPGEGGAEMYAGSYVGSAIYPAYLSISNPHETTFGLMLSRARKLANGKDDGRQIGKSEVDAYRRWLKETGKDGIKIVDNAGNASTEFKDQDAWIALEPEQIKSATGNRGTFDPNDADITRSSLRQADSPEFKKWFGNSVITEDGSAGGTPLTLYHGGFNFDEAKPNKAVPKVSGRGSLGVGFYMTPDRSRAEEYAKDSNGTVTAVYARIEKPLEVNISRGKDPMIEALVILGVPREKAEKQVEGDYESDGYVGSRVKNLATKNGYDGLVERIDGVMSEVVAWAATSVKSANNNSGEYSWSPDIRRSVDRPIFYSQLAKALSEAPDRVINQTGTAVSAWLNSNAAKLGIKKEEIEWSGITDWLKLQPGKVSREQVAAYLDGGGINVTETLLGGAVGEDLPDGWRIERHPDDRTIWHVLDEENRIHGEGETRPQAFEDAQKNSSSPTKYSGYVVPGGSNYREVLLTLPNEKARRFWGYVKTKNSDMADDILTEISAEGMESLDYGRDEESDSIIFDDIDSSSWEKIGVIVSRNGGALVKTIAEGTDESYQSPHWEQRNILAHLRVDDRIDADGGKVLFINEIQSDWAQSGRKGGFKLTEREAKDRMAMAYFGKQYSEVDGNNKKIVDESYLDNNLRRDGSGVPLAPFVTDTKSWVALAIKRAIVMAAREGYDKVAFISGEQAAELYDLSKQIDRVEYVKRSDKSWMIEAYKLGERSPIWSPQSASPETLEANLGKEVAQKIIDGGKSGTLSGLDLKFGGEGMKAFYDKIVPQVANDVLKKLGGGKVGTVDVTDTSSGWSVEDGEGNTIGGPYKTELTAETVAEDERDKGNEAKVKPPGLRQVLTQPGFDITDKMREIASEGVPLFSRDRQTETPEFKAWFGDSKVIDANGDPLVQYHSTVADFSRFKRKNNDLGFHFGTANQAEDRFLLKSSADPYGPQLRGVSHSTMPVYLAIKKPLRLSDAGAWDAGNVIPLLPDEFTIEEKVGKYTSAKVRDLIVSHGYDGIVYKNTGETSGGSAFRVALARARTALTERFGDQTSFGPDEQKDPAYVAYKAAMSQYANHREENAEDSWIAFDPRQVKSAIGNNGQFNPDDPSIIRSAARDIGDINLMNSYKVSDFIGTSKTVSLWDKTVGTMSNMAKKHPEFKRVYDAVQRFIADTSRFATRAADMAPNILPKLESLGDIWKSPLSAADAKALQDPVFLGTLSYTRDDDGKPVKTDDVGLAGVVWRDDELRGMFGLSDEQIKLYREFRRSINRSLNDLGVSDMIRYAGKDANAVKVAMLAAPTAKAAADILENHLADLALDDPARAYVLQETAATIREKANTTGGLIAKGYAPLTRFGDYTVYVKSKTGDQIYFGMFESEADARKMARQMEKDYPDATVDKGTMSKESYKLFKGVTPETLALFGASLGLEESSNKQDSQIFQEYLKLAKASRSAMKRMIERKGVEGYSEDVGRVLAGFIYSNARQTSTNLHSGEIMKSASEIKAGDLKDHAIRLTEYVNNPQEEAQGLRGLLFINYIGGSLASAAVNLTQSATTTWPVLTQHFGIGKATSAMTAAIKVATSGAGSDADLAAAMKRAQEEGITDPNETHSLQAQAAGRGSLQTGDGTTYGDLRAKTNNTMSRIQLAWGRMFGLAETMNRKIAFAAAYSLAREKGIDNPYDFAAGIVADTQFTMNKGNNPQWARGPVGATLFTFRKFMINYLEGLARMWGGGPEGKKAFALSLAVLFALAGSSGFPFADDLDDLIDFFAQRVLNKNFVSKQAKKEFFASILGMEGAEFVEKGLSGLPGVPIDVSGRLGLGNIVPGTGLLQKKRDHTSDVKEVVGAAGDFVGRMATAVGQTAQGEIGGAVQSVTPVAMSNLYKAVEMAQLGYYKDAKNRKVIDTTLTDAVLKGIGFQPNDVANMQSAVRAQQQYIELNKLREGEIADLWTRGRVERNPVMIADARRQLAEWNLANPGSKIEIADAQISRRVREANKDKASRLATTAPKEIRAAVKQGLDEELRRGAQ